MDISYYKKYEPIFGEWRIVRELGAGSFGKVFEIEREDFGHTYKAALKAVTVPQSQSEVKSVLADGMDEASATAYFRGFVEDMVNEFALMSTLKGNSNVVSYEDHKVIAHEGEIGWDILIRMELLTPLLDYSGAKAMTRSDVIQLGIDICSALELCRTNQIIHRDIKPENIFVSHSGKYKLGDFGIAKTVEKTTGGLSKKGTYTYMAPEVYKGEAYGASVDIYSLGIVLYRYMNNSRTPFLPDYPTPIKYSDRDSALARRIGGEVIPAPANADAQLAKVILKACAYKPEDRYSNPTEMRLALEAAAGTAPNADVFNTAEAPRASAVSDGTAGIFVKSNANTAPEETGKSVGTDEDATVGLFGKKAPTSEAAPKTGSEPKKQVHTEKPNRTAAARERKPYSEEDKTVGAFSKAPQGQRKPQAAAAKPNTAKKAPSSSEKPKANNQNPAQKAVKPKKKKKTILIVAAVLLLIIIISSVSSKSNSGYNSYSGPEMSIAPRVYNDTAVAITVGATHTAALKSDGTVVAAGENCYGQCDVSDWTDIVAIAAGESYTVGLKSDGTVVAASEVDYFGECNVSEWTDIIAVSAGVSHTVGLKSDGTVVAVGLNNDGQCDVSGWTDIVSISAGSGFTVGLKSDGTVVAVGFNNYGQCDVSEWTNIVAISTGYSHTVGVRADGTVVAAGRGSSGQCNVEDWTDIVAVAAGIEHTVGLKSDGTVVAVGNSWNGRCDVSNWTGITAIAAGYDNTAAIKSDGTVIVIGDNEYDQCSLYVG